MGSERTCSVSATTERVQTVGDDILPEASKEFVCTPYVQELTARALTYLEAGFPVHFAGSAGTGKTTLAFHVAARLGRAVTLIHGDDEFSTSDLVGRDAGYRRHKLIDNFIHSVVKTEEELKSLWVDQRLTTACERGDTLIYDEFNRSRPEANNALLTILSERILNLPQLRSTSKGYLEVHPGFSAIFTSNPDEYAGTHQTQDALMDRLITIRLGHYDRETEVQITMARSGIPRPDASTIVDIVRNLRSVEVGNHRPTIRACIAIARVLHLQGGRAHPDDAVFQSVCRDVLDHVGCATVTRNGQSLTSAKAGEVIQEVCGTERGVRM